MSLSILPSFPVPSPVPSLLFDGASPEAVHQAEGSHVLAQQDALLHGEDAAGEQQRNQLSIHRPHGFKSACLLKKVSVFR